MRRRSDPGAVRCEAMITVSLTGRRCKMVAEPDSDPPRCYRHMAIRDAEKQYMTRFYYKTFKPTLAAKVQELLEESLPIEQMDVSEEVALMRVAAQDAVELYSNACEDPKVGAEARMAAGIVMKAALKDVIDGVSTAARVEEVKQKVASTFVNTMSAVLTAVMRAAWDAFGDDYRMKEFEQALHSRLTAAQVYGAQIGSVDGTEGTLLTPDQDVIEMDQSVPREDAGEANDAEQ